MKEKFVDFEVVDKVPRKRNFNFRHEVKRPVWYRKPDKEGNVLPVAVDQFPAQNFNKNAYGWPANDITLLQRATTQAEYDLIAARLLEVKKENPNFEGKDDSYIIKSIWPRGVQCPSEIQNFMKYYNENVAPVDFTSTSTADGASDAVPVDAALSEPAPATT